MLFKVLNTAAICLALTALALAQQPSGAKGDPQAVIETSHDFGEVKTGTPLKWTFKIKNNGKSDLLIQNVAPS